MRTEYRFSEDGSMLTYVILSRRNLLALLAKLDDYPNDSAYQLFGDSNYPITIVKAEEDKVHYAHPSRHSSIPGEMHPDTEEQVNPNQGRLF